MPRALPLRAVIALAPVLFLGPSVARAQLRVGPGETYATVAEAAAAATDGDTVEIVAGTYHEEIVWTQSDLTIRGVGGRAVLDMTGRVLTRQGGKGIFILDGANVTVESLELVGASAPDGNGAGIRWQGGGTLTVRDCVFRDDENGILGGNHADNVALIEQNEFVGNGRGDHGYTHSLYINEIDTLTFRGNWSHALVEGTPDIGHLFKSRAHHNYVLYNRLTAEDSHSSYELQLPEGGVAYVIGNLIEQGSMGPNRTVISIGGDGMQWPDPRVFIVNNTLVNADSGGTFISATAPIALDVVNNLMIGPGTPLSGGTVSRMLNNLTADPSVLVSTASYDYHLALGSSPIDAGLDPGLDGTMSLRPLFEYAHPHGLVPRATVGVLDVGAYEFGSAGDADAGGVAGDAGASDAGPVRDGGALRDAIVADDAGRADGDAGPGLGTNGGCCRVATGRAPSTGALLASLALLAAACVRRRRS